MEVLHVTAAIIQQDGRVLITQRKEGSHMGLKWEFPGGKIEHGESAEECLKREIKEELDIDVGVGKKLMVVEHQYNEKKVILHCYWCRFLEGKFKARECRDFKWVNVSDLKNFDFAGADLPVVKKLMEHYL
ncbi:MAG: 8-oxo-dGTP diphosphatase MutT [Firmicutes bacterium]|nr:8-oxo-dGTP diphosphatase MutT [Bacillota bacterium]